MILTEGEYGALILAMSLPRYKVRRTTYGNNWRVELEGVTTQPVAVFTDWRDAVAFARWKATT